MIRSGWTIVCLIALLILACSADTKAQVIAARDLPNFIGRLRVLDSWGDTLDLSHFTEWRIDSLSRERLMEGRMESPDSGGCWIVCSGEKAATETSHFLAHKEFRRVTFQLMAVVWGWDIFPGRLLSVWIEIGVDSLEFIGIDSVVSRSGIDNIKQVMYFPDSSMLLFCKAFECYHGSVSGSEQFFRAVDPLNFQPIYSTSWSNFRPTKTYVLYDRLYFDRYRVSEITEFLSRPSHQTLGIVTAGPSLIYDGSLIDSAKIRVIDLWELAKQKFGIDTSQIDRDTVLEKRP